jgi:hypothetical protein
MGLAGIVRVSRVDLEAELRKCFLAGMTEVSIGIGDGVDISLLTDDLLAADVEIVEREVLVATVSLMSNGRYAVSRDVSNFGVFVNPITVSVGWLSVPPVDCISGLAPGAGLGLGSCPGEAVHCVLPGIHGVHLQDAGVARPGLERRFRTALNHWSYSNTTFGEQEDFVIPMMDCAGLHAVLIRDIDEPSVPMRLLASGLGPGLATSNIDRAVFEDVQLGRVVTLAPEGTLLRIGGQVVALPPALRPTPRFTERGGPGAPDVADVFGLDIADLSDGDRVKKRFRELAKGFHPDHAADIAKRGHQSRFMEVQACWAAYQSMGLATTSS